MVVIITLSDINLAIVTQVTNSLNDTDFKNTKFNTTDITEEIERPCFYISFEENKTGKFNCSCKKRNTTVKLYYFAKDKNNCKLEILDMQDLLENTFIDYLKVNEDFFIPISDIEFEMDIKQGYLTAEFELYTIEELPEPDAELMEELEFNNTSIK